jgi:predicted dehydrogenase
VASIDFSFQQGPLLMSQRTLGLIMNGVSGRMGVNQHLIRSVAAIRAQGGVLMSDGSRVMLDPVLVSRTGEKVKALAEQHGGLRWTTDLDAEIASPRNHIFFDTATTQMRPTLLEKAIHAGKHIYCEKPIATNLAEALKICRLAKEKGIKNGTVQDKLFLPGLQKIKLLRDSGFFGRIFAVRGEFGYWVFEGDWGQPAQRPSWNYKKAEGGGIILDMLCHWRYVLDNLFGEVKSVLCHGAVHIPERVDEQGKRYRPPPTTPPIRFSSSRAASSRRSTARGPRGSAATTSSPSRSTARMARPWPA